MFRHSQTQKQTQFTEGENDWSKTIVYFILYLNYILVFKSTLTAEELTFHMDAQTCFCLDRFQSVWVQRQPQRELLPSDEVARWGAGANSFYYQAALSTHHPHNKH